MFKLSALFVLSVILCVTSLVGPTLAARSVTRSYRLNGELEFLRKFYFALGGTYWRNNTGWKDLENSRKTFDDLDYCKWHGVKCLHEAVFTLTLPNNNMTGVLPTGISQLRSLWILHLANNYLYGQIPEEYGSLPSLNGIELANNYFEGVLPEGICGVLSCDAFNNPKLKCPSNNCRNNHCNMSQCNCGGLTMCNSDYDCAGKLCTKCKMVNGNQWYKICQ